ncbi:MAG: hypothetical protein ACI4GO_08195 [Hominenteromicrobium sp.]
MRRCVVWLFTVLCLFMPVSAQAVFRGETNLGRMDFAAEAPSAEGVYRAQLVLKNDTAASAGVFVQAETQTNGELRLTVRQNGKTSPVFEGDAAALAGCRVLLCRLETQGSAVLYGEWSGAAQPAVLALTAEPLEDPDSINRLKLIFCACIWMALVMLGCYLAIVLSGRFGKKK